MGLSASSLRLAMLTARKSSLEFEGQQINQQRLTLSNQTAELFNSMLTMQVPTPPDPSEFSKMVYTFNKGNGVSTLLNVSRNPSGPYTHDVTYKGPKTDNVLMKKQLNNVGFKHENDQMSAVIDGLNYPLTLNGDEEKLNDYLETKKTYDHIKNIETQKRALESMPQDKELSSSQMRQYFEALGLSSYDTPSQGKVEDVETLDDAFKNVYNSGEYIKDNVTIEYVSSTLPNGISLSYETDCMLAIDADKREIYNLKMVDNDDKKYTYTDKKYGDLCSITYDEKTKTWSYSAENVSENVLNCLGIYYCSVLCYQDNNSESHEVENENGYHITDYTSDELEISECYYNNNGWSYVVTPPWDNSNITFKKTSTKEVAIITTGGTYISKDGKEYTISGKYPKFEFTRQEKKSETVNNNEIETGYTLDNCESFLVSNDSKIACLQNIKFFKNQNGIYEPQNLLANLGINCQIDNTGLLTVTESENKFGNDGVNIAHNGLGIISINPNIQTPSDDMQKPSNDKQTQSYFFQTGLRSFIQKTASEVDCYYLNLTTNYVACNEQNVLITDENDLSGDKENYVKVQKNEDGKWQYTYQLTNADSSSIKETKIYGRNTYVFQKNNTYTRTDNDGVTYTLLQNGKESTISHFVSKTETLSGVGLTAYYDNTYLLDSDGKCRIQGEQKPPPGINKETIYFKDRYKYINDTSSDKPTAENEPEKECTFSNKGITVNRNSDGTYNIEGKLEGEDCLPPHIYISPETDRTEKKEIGGINYSIRQEFGTNYYIEATFSAYVSSSDKNKVYYEYDKNSHTLRHLITDEEFTEKQKQANAAQILLRNQNNQREEDDTNLTVNKMLGFFEEVLKQFGLYGSSINYKTKLDRAKAAYIDTLDAKGVENPDDNQALYSFIDANGNKAYIYVPLEYVKDDGHVESTYAYMCETSYLENQTETISQKANIIYDENGRIVKISFDDGTVVLPEVKTEQDEDAYNAAMVKYDYEKQVYDKELSDINTKTEIIAQQDKNLEIKLKSIDSQHSAISTEIEALKKVLDSSVKSSFGTFSA